MKRYFSILMMALSLLIGFQQAIIVVLFKLNQKNIEQQFCVNKNQPEMQCHGVCHLKKQLQQTENSETASIGVYRRVDMLPISSTEFEARSLTVEIWNHIPIYKEIYYTEPYRETLVPPPIA